MANYNFDNWPALKAFTFQDFTFRGSRYEIWREGSMVSSGNSFSCIHFFTDKKNGRITVMLEKTPYSHLLSPMQTYDGAICLNDRILLYVSPKNTNVTCNTLAMLSSVIGYTRDSNYYNDNEPVAASIFTVNGDVVKVSFTFANPDRLIEFYL